MEITEEALAYVVFRVQSSFLLDLAAQYETQAAYMRQALREIPLSKEKMKEVERIFMEVQKRWSPSWWNTWRKALQEKVAIDTTELQKLRHELSLVYGRMGQTVPNRRRK